MERIAVSVFSPDYAGDNLEPTAPVSEDVKDDSM